APVAWLFLLLSSLSHVE
ncbi:hypothetical protein E2320_006388, partial [Naja naja]